VAGSTVNLGRNEFAARLPLALLGALAALATYALGARLRRPRAGLYAALALMCSPLFLFESRQLTSDVGAVTGAALAMLGFAGLAWPRGPRSSRAIAGDAALVIAGLVLGQLAVGMLLGVLIPLASAALAALPFAWPRAEQRSVRGFAAAAAGASVLVLIVVATMLFDLEPAQPGQRAVFGQTLVAAKEYLPWLAGTWRSGEAPVTSTFKLDHQPGRLRHVPLVGARAHRRAAAGDDRRPRPGSLGRPRHRRLGDRQLPPRLPLAARLRRPALPGPAGAGAGRRLLPRRPPHRQARG
jgi:hypothetical protein